jgi:hypothetical protein
MRFDLVDLQLFIAVATEGTAIGGTPAQGRAALKYPGHTAHVPRHCERSEAIQSLGYGCNGIASSLCSSQ